MATHSSIVAWRISWTEEPGGLQPRGSQRVNTTEAAEHAHTSDPQLSCRTRLWLILLRPAEGARHPREGGLQPQARRGEAGAEGEVTL